MTGKSVTEDLQWLLDDNIPLARASGAQVDCFDALGLRINAPLEPNSNHHGTAFGGSLYVVALAAGWGLTHLLLKEAEVDANLYIQHAEADYLRPVTSDLSALAARPSAPSLKSFLHDLQSTGRGKIQIEISIDCMQQRAFDLRGDFAARMQVTA